MSLADTEVRLGEVLEWAQEQAQFLSPTQAHVLLYLCINAWRTDHNGEDVPAGAVLSGRTALRKIQMFTGLSQRAVRYALDDLQDAGYIFAEHVPGNGRSRILVLWSPDADERRAEFRAGVRELPEVLRRPSRKPKGEPKTATEGNVVDIRSRLQGH